MTYFKRILLRTFFTILICVFFLLSTHAETKYLFRNSEKFNKPTIGISLVYSIGYLGFLGNSSKQFSNGIVLSASCDFYLNRFHLFVKSNTTSLTRTKTDLNISTIKSNDHIEHNIPFIALGYDIKYEKYNFLIPYIGYGWHESKIWDQSIKDYTNTFKYSGLVVGLNWKKDFYIYNKRYLEFLKYWEHFDLTDIDFFVTMVNNNQLNNGLIYAIRLGYSINFRKNIVKR